MSIKVSESFLSKLCGSTYCWGVGSIFSSWGLGLQVPESLQGFCSISLLGEDPQRIFSWARVTEAGFISYQAFLETASPSPQEERMLLEPLKYLHPLFPPLKGKHKRRKKMESAFLYGRCFTFEIWDISPKAQQFCKHFQAVQAFESAT